MRARYSALVLVTFAWSVGAAAPAHAGTVTASSGALNFNAGAGEVNTVTLEQSGTTFTVTDSTTALTAGPGCAPVNTNRATCEISEVDSVFFDLDDLGDMATIAASVAIPRNAFKSFSGEAGNDTLNAGPGIEASYSGGEGNDTLNGSLSGDRLNGGDGNDALTGGEGADALDGGLGNDLLAGQAGNDDIESSQSDGADVLSGGPGEGDGLNFGGRGIGASLIANGAPDDGQGCPGPGCEGDDFAADFEQITGTAGNDTIVPGGGPNRVNGGRGDDLIDGGAGRDELSGEDGNDTLGAGRGDDLLRAGEGADNLSGGPGDDVIQAFAAASDVLSGGRGLDLASFARAVERLRIDLDNRPDDGATGDGANVRRDVEDIVGGQAGDVLIGSKAANELTGGGGRDRLVGGAGADGLLGEDGADTIVGGKGSDLLDGGGGPDRLRARDNRRDEVRCGAAFDVAFADAADRRAEDCDRVRRGGRG